MSVHEQALVNARRDGFLVNLTLDVGVRQSWMEEASAGAFPYVEIVPLGVGKGVRLGWEVTHLPADVAVKARTFLQLAKVRHPKVEIGSVTPTCEYIGPLPMADARALAGKIAALRGSEHVVT